MKKSEILAKINRGCHLFSLFVLFFCFSSSLRNLNVLIGVLFKGTIETSFWTSWHERHCMLSFVLSANCDKSFSTGILWTCVCPERTWYLTIWRTFCTITVPCGQRRWTSEYCYDKWIHCFPVGGWIILKNISSEIFVYTLYIGLSCQVATKCKSQWSFASQLWKGNKHWSL